MYQVIVLPKALKDLSNLDRTIAKRVIDKLMWLSDNIETMNPLALKSNLSGFYKLKIGDYRALYDIEHSKKIIYIHKIGHRKEIYKY